MSALGPAAKMMTWTTTFSLGSGDARGLADPGVARPGFMKDRAGKQRP